MPPSTKSFVFFLLAIIPCCVPETTITMTSDTLSHRWGTVEAQRNSYDDWGGYGYNTGYSYQDTSNHNQGTVMKWDPTYQRWVVQQNYGCRGQLVDYVNGQQRFICDCGANGGVSYQIGRCQANVPDTSFEAMERKPKNQGYRYVWDPASGRYRLGAQTECNGKWIDYVNGGQMRFLCDCGMFGGVTYQIGTCNPTIPTLKSLGLPQSAGKK